MSENYKQIRSLVHEIEEVLYSDFAKAKHLTEQLLDLSMSLNDSFGIYKANNWLGVLSTNEGKIDEALNYFTIAMTYTSINGLGKEKPSILNNIGTALIVKQNYFEAIENLSSALNYIYEFDERKDLIFLINLNIADAYLHIHQPKETISVIERAMPFYDDAVKEEGAVMLATLAYAFILLEDYNKAYEYILLCEEAAEQSRYVAIQILVDFYKAKYFELTDAHDDAMYFYERVIKHQLEGNTYYYYNQISLDFIEFLKSNHHREKARQYIESSIDLANKMGWNWTVQYYYKAQAELYADELDWQNALRSVKTYFDMEQEYKQKSNLLNFNCFKIQEKILNINAKNRSLNDSVQRLKQVNSILKLINSTSDVKLLIKILYDSLKTLLNIETFALGLYEDEENRIHYVSKFENGVSVGESNISYNNEKSFSVFVKRTGTPIIINDISDLNAIQASYPNVKFTKDDIVNRGNHSQSLVIWPLITESRSIGLINCQSTSKNTFSDFDLELIEMLAAHLAVALENFKQKSELREAITRLNRLSFIDSLTNVYNRQAFNEYLPQFYQRAIDEKNNLAFAMVDLDNFKNLNDQYGHQEGDLCLIAFADLIKRTIGNLGYIYRYGGDEFSLLFIGLDKALVQKILEEIMLLSKSVYSVGEVLRITASMGAIFVENGKCKSLPLNAFINYADNALYIAKSEGKNTFKFVDYTE
ncbi:sensor domain-containing diguanylate cyclase [Fusibacter bizertensis]